MANEPQDFPGFPELLRAIASYGGMLKTQGEIWNDAWKATLSGNFDFKSWTSTVANSWDAYARYWFNYWQHPGSPSGEPAWKRIPWPLDAPEDPPPCIEVTLQRAIVSTLHVTTFCFLGSATPAVQAITAAAAGDAPGLSVRILNPSIGQLELKVREPKSGHTSLVRDSYYIAFIFEVGKIEPPLLIVLLHVMGKSPESDQTTTPRSDAK